MTLSTLPLILLSTKLISFTSFPSMGFEMTPLPDQLIASLLQQGEPTRPIDAEHHEISGVFVGANQSGAVSINTNLRRARQSVLPSRNLENGVRHGRVYRSQLHYGAPDEIHVMTNLDRVEDTLLRNRTQNVEELRIPRKGNIGYMHLLIHSPYIFFPRQQVMDVNAVVSVCEFASNLPRAHDDQQLRIPREEHLSGQVEGRSKCPNYAVRHCLEKTNSVAIARKDKQESASSPPTKATVRSDRTRSL